MVPASTTMRTPWPYLLEQPALIATAARDRELDHMEMTIDDVPFARTRNGRGVLSRERKPPRLFLITILPTDTPGAVQLETNSLTEPNPTDQ